MKSFILLPLLALGTYLLLKMRKRKTQPSRYERKAQTPWNSLNNGEDPTL